MNKVRGTVLKTTYDTELAGEYGAAGPLPMLKPGQEFYRTTPAGGRVRGVEGIHQYVFALAHGAGDSLFYYGDWIKTPGVAICSCNDGLRPVIFKLEVTTAARYPKNAHDTANLGRQTASTMLIMWAVIELFERIVNEKPLVRRIYLGANRIVPADSVSDEPAPEKLNLFTDYDALLRRAPRKKLRWSGKSECNRRC